MRIFLQLCDILIDFVVKLTITKMELNVIAVGIYTLTCTSTGSPPTTVTWMRNEVTLSAKEKYTSSQILINRQSSTYDNVLTIKGDAMGNYTCKISNSRHETLAEKTINGK